MPNTGPGLLGDEDRIAAKTPAAAPAAGQTGAHGHAHPAAATPCRPLQGPGTAAARQPTKRSPACRQMRPSQAQTPHRSSWRPAGARPGTAAAHQPSKRSQAPAQQQGPRQETPLSLQIALNRAETLRQYTEDLKPGYEGGFPGCLASLALPGCLASLALFLSSAGNLPCRCFSGKSLPRTASSLANGFPGCLAILALFLSSAGNLRIRCC